MMFDYPYPRRNYRNQDLFYILRAYLLYHTGTLLNTNKITQDLMRMNLSDDFSVTDDTVAKYLNAMSQTEVFCLEREYVKPHHVRDANKKDDEDATGLSFGKRYFLACTPEEFDYIYGSDRYQRIVRYYDPSGKHKPSYKVLYRKTDVCHQLNAKYATPEKKLKCGTIIYHYLGADGKDHKVKIEADFVAEKDGQKTVFILSTTRSLLPSYGRDVDPHVIKALISLKRYAKIPVVIVSLWDTEPTNKKYLYTKAILEDNEYLVIPWNAL